MNTKKIHNGDLIARAGVVYDCEEITGNIDCRNADWNTKIDQLTTVGGSAYFRGWTGSAPKLTTVGSSAYFRGWTGSAPKLTTVGGSADFQGWTGSAKTIKTNDESAPDKCRKELSASFRRNGFHFADGILAKLVATKGRVSRVIVCGKKTVSYVVEVGEGVYSHGATLKEARESLLYKIGSRDTSEYKRWTMDTKKTLGEMIVAYRVITGACEGGVRNFCESKGELPKVLTVADVVKLTAGSYGAETFKKFFERVK